MGQDPWVSGLVRVVHVLRQVTLCPVSFVILSQHWLAPCSLWCRPGQVAKAATPEQMAEHSANMHTVVFYGPAQWATVQSRDLRLLCPNPRHTGTFIPRRLVARVKI